MQWLLVNQEMGEMTGICDFYKMELLDLYNTAPCKARKNVVFYRHKEELKKQIFNLKRYLKIRSPAFKSIPLKGTIRKEKMTME